MQYLRGASILIVGGIFLSTSGIFVRFIESADPWLILFIRSVSFSLTVLVFMFFHGNDSVRHQFRQMQPKDAIVSVSLGFGFIFYLFGIFHTTIANAMFILSTGPFLAALLGWICLKERVSVTSLIAMAVAAVGISIMVSGGFDGTHHLGMLFAFGAVAMFAIMIVTMRSSAAERDMLPATMIGGLIAAGISLFFISDFQISNWDFLMAGCLGVIQVGFGFIAITLGTRYVPALHVPLLTLSEIVLAPIWVWLLVNEVPAQSTLIGGGVVLATVVFQGMMGVIQTREA